MRASNLDTEPDTKKETDYTFVAGAVLVGVVALGAAIDGFQWAAQSLTPHLYAATVEGIGGTFAGLISFGDHALTKLWESLAALPFEQWAKGDSPRANLNELLQTYGVVFGIFGMCLLLFRWLVAWPTWLKAFHVLAVLILFFHFEGWRGEHDKTPMWLFNCVYFYALISTVWMGSAFAQSVRDRSEDGEEMRALEMSLARGISRMMGAHEDMTQEAPFGDSNAARLDELGGR